METNIEAKKLLIAMKTVMMKESGFYEEAINQPRLEGKKADARSLPVSSYIALQKIYEVPGVTWSKGWIRNSRE